MTSWGVDPAFGADPAVGLVALLEVRNLPRLQPDQQVAMGREIDAVATADATVILTVWAQRRRPVLHPAERFYRRQRLTL